MNRNKKWTILNLNVGDFLKLLIDKRNTVLTPLISGVGSNVDHRIS